MRGGRLPSLPSGSLPVTSCTDLTELQRQVLGELAAGEEPSDPATVEELRRWGWVMPGSLELTGVGLSHVCNDERRPGVL